MNALESWWVSFKPVVVEMINRYCVQRYRSGVSGFMGPEAYASEENGLFKKTCSIKSMSKHLFQL